MKGKKISGATIEKFIGYFIDSFIISKANRYDVKGKKYIGSPYKIYTDDSFKKIVVVRNPVVPRYDDFGCVVIGIYDFLLNENSLEI